MLERLSVKRAVKLSIELWKFLSQTGCQKYEWYKWQNNGGQYPHIHFNCFLCELNHRREVRHHKQISEVGCPYCPYYLKYGRCTTDGFPFKKWADSFLTDARAKYAKQFLAQLEEIQKDIDDGKVVKR